MKNILPKSALISLSDKTNLDLLVSFLLERNVEIISTGGTYKAIKKITNNVMEVSEYTGHKEMMGGRVKTLHPKIHAGILARRGEDTDILKSSFIIKTIIIYQSVLFIRKISFIKKTH